MSCLRHLTSQSLAMAAHVICHSRPSDVACIDIHQCPLQLPQCCLVVQQDWGVETFTSSAYWHLSRGSGRVPYADCATHRKTMGTVHTRCRRVFQRAPHEHGTPKSDPWGECRATCQLQDHGGKLRLNIPPQKYDVRRSFHGLFGRTVRCSSTVQG